MSKSLLQPIGQKRLTNVAVVRLKKHGNRFEIACYKNKVLSYRSSVEKDVNEVLHSYTVYSNVSKGIIAKSKDLRAAFGTDDWGKVCLEILDKGELQVAGKERESEFQSQFRDIATIVMQKTINPETQRPYTISMIERLMHDIHFAVDPKSSPKKQFLANVVRIYMRGLYLWEMLRTQALEVIRELQKQFPIKRAPMQLRLIVSEENMSSLLEKLNGWDANLVSRDESGKQLICEIDPGLFRDCDALMRSLQGKLEVLAVNVHVERDTHVDNYDEHEDEPSKLDDKESTRLVAKLSNKLQNQATSASGVGTSEGEQKQLKCSTCNTYVGDLKEYRVHFKSEWHNHNVKRKIRQLSPLTADEFMADVQLGDSMDNLKDYS